MIEIDKNLLVGKTLLIVDDEPEIREIIASEIKCHGVNIFEAKNGEEAFKIILNNKINTVVSDVRMPIKSGIELLQMIKQRNPHIPIVILMSGFTDIESAQAIQLGAVALLEKPPDWKVFIEVILKAVMESPVQ